VCECNRERQRGGGRGGGPGGGSPPRASRKGVSECVSEGTDADVVRDAPPSYSCIH